MASRSVSALFRAANEKRVVKHKESRPCSYCGGSEKLGTDHVVPKSRNGPDVAENRVPCCRECNAAKNKKLPSEWLKVVPSEIQQIERSICEKFGPIKSLTGRPKKELPHRTTITLRLDRKQLAELKAITKRERTTQFQMVRVLIRETHEWLRKKNP